MSNLANEIFRPGMKREKPRARGVRRERGTMNKTEKAYSDTLRLRMLAGVIQAWWFEAWTFRLADRTTYTPDFVVMLSDGTIEAHEVKGFMEDDAAVKIKVAAEHFPLRFYIVKRKGTAWETRLV